MSQLPPATLKVPASAVSTTSLAEINQPPGEAVASVRSTVVPAVLAIAVPHLSASEPSPTLNAEGGQ
jgi:hypothetical protein